MRSGFLALCGLLGLPSLLPGQGNMPPTIVAEPAGLSVYVGETATLTAEVDGTAPLAVQWFKNSLALSGATHPTLTLTAVAASDAGVYHLIATNAYGVAQTRPVGLHVSRRPQEITFIPPTTTVVAGSGVVLNATASSGLAVSYSLVSGSATISGNVLTGSAGSVTVRAAQAGNAAIAAAPTVDVTFTFVAGGLAPFITSPPLDQTIDAGGSVTLRATAIGHPAPTLRWSKAGATLPETTGPTLTLTDVTLADAGRYTVTATNVSGTHTASVTLTVRAAPAIAAGPASQTVFAGDRVTLAAAVTGFPAPTFQWRRNGSVVAGATAATLTLDPAVAADAGSYTLTATNALGTATSEPATLTVGTRDFAGVYFGRFTGGDGDFALLVRPDRSALLLGVLPGRQTGLAAGGLRVELAGGFTLATTTLTGARVTLRGALDDATGTVTGTIAELGVALSGSRSPATGPAAGLAGAYSLALVGSAAGRAQAIVAPDGQAFLLTATGATPEAVTGRLDATGRLTVTTPAQATLDLVFSGGNVSGTVRTPAGVTGPIAGVSEAFAGREHLANLSIRTATAPGAGTLITGFVITGTASKQVLIRAAGPALAAAPFNVAGVLADPSLQLFRGATPVGQNDDWGTPAASATAITAAATRAGAFPFRAGSADAALLSTLAPGSYSVVVSGGTGVVLAEIYEVLQNNEAPGSRRLVNVSARGAVAPGAPFVSGFVLSGPGPQRVLIRGLGPALAGAPFNVAGALPNPQLTLFRGPTAVKANDDWFRDPDAAVIRDATLRAGAFALGASSLDAALLLYLEPGAYTAQVTGPANATGLVLLEVYEATL